MTEQHKYDMIFRFDTKNLESKLCWSVHLKQFVTGGNVVKFVQMLIGMNSFTSRCKTKSVGKTDFNETCKKNVAFKVCKYYI